LYPTGKMYLSLWKLGFGGGCAVAAHQTYYGQLRGKMEGVELRMAGERQGGGEKERRGGG